MLSKQIFDGDRCKIIFDKSNEIVNNICIVVDKNSNIGLINENCARYYKTFLGLINEGTNIYWLYYDLKKYFRLDNDVVDGDFFNKGLIFKCNNSILNADGRTVNIKFVILTLSEMFQYVILKSFIEVSKMNSRECDCFIQFLLIRQNIRNFIKENKMMGE